MGPFISAATTQVYLLLVWIKDWIEWKKYLEEFIYFLLTAPDTAVWCNTTLFLLEYEHIHCDIPLHRIYMTSGNYSSCLQPLKHYGLLGCDTVVW